METEYYLLLLSSLCRCQQINVDPSKLKMSTRNKFVSTHLCDLKRGSDSCLPKLPPQAGRIRRFFRKCRKILVVSDANPDCQEVLRSHAAVTHERLRSLHSTKWYIIHPFSQLSVLIEIIAAISWMVVFLKDPYAVAFLPVIKKNEDIVYISVTILTDIILLMYTITCFITGKPVPN